MRCFLVVAAVAALALQVDAQTRDVSPSAKQEIARRGAWVEQTGTIRGGLITAAFAPPADDSGKWYITLIGRPGEADFEAMRSMIASNRDEALASWIDAHDSAKSFTHYQVRFIDDVTQRSWLEGLQPAIGRYGLPMIVLQPPLNGQFGKPETIVKGIHGRYGAKELAGLLRAGVVTYVSTLEAPIAGHRDERPVIGVAPPFNVQPVQPQAVIPNNPIPQAGPVDWPPSKPTELTIDQIQQACPGATPEFVLNAMSSKETNLELLKLKWMLYQKDHPQPVDVVKEIVPVNPLPCPVPTAVQGLSPMQMIATGLGLGLIFGVMLISLGMLIVRLLGARSAKQDAIQQELYDRARMRDRPQTFPNSTFPNSTFPNGEPNAAPSWKPPASNVGQNG